MATRDEVLFHGSDGDSILGIVTSGTMLPRHGKIFFSKYRWEDSLTHGGDRRRRASFVAKIKVTIPDAVTSRLEQTSGVPFTFVVETNLPLQAEVLELYVRRPGRNGFDTQRLTDLQSIKSFLQT